MLLPIDNAIIYIENLRKFAKKKKNILEPSKKSHRDYRFMAII